MRKRLQSCLFCTVLIGADRLAYEEVGFLYKNIYWKNYKYITGSVIYMENVSDTEKTLKAKKPQIIGIDDVSDDIIIARYFTREKLEILVDKQELWFANIEKFTDKKERTIPDGFFNNFTQAQKSYYKKLHTLLDEKRKAYISCWTKFDAENYALWKIYDKCSNGACLITTVGKIKEALEKIRADVIVTEVEYVDLEDRTKKYNLPWVIYESDTNSSMTRVRMTEKYKQKPYKFEQEIRFIIYDKAGNDGFGEKLDFAALIDRIVLSPFANDEEQNHTKDLLKKLFSEKIFEKSVIDDQ